MINIVSDLTARVCLLEDKQIQCAKPIMNGEKQIGSIDINREGDHIKIVQPRVGGRPGQWEDKGRNENGMEFKGGTKWSKVKPSTYDGKTSPSFFLDTFKGLAGCNRWDDREMGVRLHVLLTGEAK